ncbi:hypothetical protein [Oceanirhabdus sp. W0125-5]|uniref:hypothetical protein n=1 Tax=Oceanirhabdus sp. W0125-5 TaxID=2999116 RepID=UPI0022F3443B|nr:hypothetical protein [Oceanirhabdus sp. W0125-5]WBW98705.1 hypothetical protein OW730_08085 [Oceanirhabdus sp. W0125-5]
MKEQLVKLIEIILETCNIIYNELKKLYHFTKKRVIFLINKQRTMKELTSPLITQREVELKELCKKRDKLKKCTSNNSNLILKHERNIENLKHELNILSEF